MRAHPDLPVTSEFARLLEEKLRDPEIRSAYEDDTVLQRVIDQLVGMRKALHLSQTEVARRMGVKQPTVSGFETEASDPRLSTLQRYARAVEARLTMDVDWVADCDWVPPKYSRGNTAVVPTHVKVSGGKPAANWRKTDFVVAA